MGPVTFQWKLRVLVDNTTASANVARELYAAAKAKGFDFLDAPVSGGQAGAQNGVLTVMCGGDADPFEAMKPVAMAFGPSFLIAATATNPTPSRERVRSSDDFTGRA